MAERNGFKWPENFRVGALIAPGLNTPEVDRSWTPVLAKDTGMKVDVAYVSDNNKANKFKWMRYGIVDIADGGAYEFSQMLRGERYFADRDTGAFPVRVVWVFSKYDSGFMVRGDSHIKDIYDIKPGVRVVDMRPYLPSQRNVEGLLAWAGIYDLEKDISEQQDVSAKYPEVVDRLTKLADKMRQDLGDSLKKIEGKGKRLPGQI